MAGNQDREQRNGTRKDLKVKSTATKDQTINKDNGDWGRWGSGWLQQTLDEELALWEANSQTHTHTHSLPNRPPPPQIRDLF